MPNFDVRFTGAALVRWADPPTEDLPTRINPAPNHPLVRRRGTVGVQVTISAVVGGVVGPLDAALDDELFVGWFLEYPTQDPPAVTVPAGQSSVRRFTPSRAGHYTYILRRRGGGGTIVHVDVI